MLQHGGGGGCAGRGTVLSRRGRTGWVLPVLSEGEGQGYPVLPGGMGYPSVLSWGCPCKQSDTRENITTPSYYVRGRQKCLLKE